MTRRVLVVRLDAAGDVLLAGPAVRAVAADAEVSLLCGPEGAPAGRLLLPGVRRVLVWASPWIANPAPPLMRADVDDVVTRLAAVVAGREPEPGRGGDRQRTLGFGEVLGQLLTGSQPHVEQRARVVDRGPGDPGDPGQPQQQGRGQRRLVERGEDHGLVEPGCSR